jgi:ribonuclease HI
MLFNCQNAVSIWKGIGLDSKIDEALLSGRPGSEVLASLLGSNNDPMPNYESIQTRELIAVTAWYIWWIRRRLSHGEQIPPIRNCVSSIRAITVNSSRAKSVNYNVEKITWLKPRGNFVKVNVDAAFNAEEGNGATGAIIRNSQGMFLAAGARFIPHVASASMAEALAILHGLQLATNMGFTKVEAESDALEVIHMCAGDERIWNDATAIYAQIITIASSIGEVEFLHCNRELNSIAHLIASNSLSSRTSCSWVEEPPSFILQPLLDDVTIM